MERTGLIREEFLSDQQLLTSIVRDLIAYVIVNGPTDTTGSNTSHDYPGWAKSRTSGAMVESSPWLTSGNGTVYAQKVFVELCGIKRIFVSSHGSFRTWVPELSKSGTTAILHTFKLSSETLRILLDGGAGIGHKVFGIPLCGLRCSLAKKLIKGGKLKQTSSAYGSDRLVPTRQFGDWNIFEVGNVPKMNPDILSFIERPLTSEERDQGIAIIELFPNRFKDDLLDSIIRKTWTLNEEVPLLPYDLHKRLQALPKIGAELVSEILDWTNERQKRGKPRIT